MDVERMSSVALEWEITLGEAEREWARLIVRQISLGAGVSLSITTSSESCVIVIWSNSWISV